MFTKWCSIFLISFLVIGCEQAKQVNEDTTPTQTIESDKTQLVEKTEGDVHTQVFTIPEGVTFKTVDWPELMPEKDLEALMNPPDYLGGIEDGSFEDQIASQIQNAINPEPQEMDDYQRALISTDIIEAMDGEHIRIPGFVVPLEFNDKQVATSFFLVPFFGACIHAPPPPPNQIIYVEYEPGVAIASIYDPVWVSGKLSTLMMENELATAAYSMELIKLELFEDF
ncbi:DUF3299 domain-containing protein [Thalassotalea euphylliae]|uniref:DUF3299 domain-containing protein n=1 Tax=Thalassotalea euphylliae TaxID=1655234 RepID=UPI00363A5D38